MSTHSCAVLATILSTGGKFRPVSNCMQLHTLTLAACSYALLYCIMEADVIILIEHALDIIAAYFNTFATPMLEGKQVDTFLSIQFPW